MELELIDDYLFGLREDFGCKYYVTGPYWLDIRATLTSDYFRKEIDYHFDVSERHNYRRGFCIDISDRKNLSLEEIGFRLAEIERGKRRIKNHFENYSDIGNVWDVNIYNHMRDVRFNIKFWVYFNVLPQ